jgi:hypothetical protein
MAVVRSLPTSGTIHVSATSPVNAALGKPASADSEQTAQGNVASDGDDGDETTRWCAGDANLDHFWQVDLGTEVALTGSQIVWGTADAYGYRIDTSDDATSWMTVVDRMGTGAIDTDSFARTARYVRITVTSLPPGAPACFFEMRVFSGATSLTAGSVDIPTSN